MPSGQGMKWAYSTAPGLHTGCMSAVVISELHDTYADVDIPVHAINDQPRKMVLNRLQLGADQPSPQYLNVIVRWPPLVQRQTTEQKVRYLITQTILSSKHTSILTAINVLEVDR